MMTENWLLGGELYLPNLEDAEVQYGIPHLLLARIAFEESSWRPAVISGLIKSRAGCIGLMQLNPIFYPNAGKNWEADVDTAGDLMQTLYKRFSDWQVAVGAYNWGAGNMDMWLKGDQAMPLETSNYVGSIVADVPVSGRVVPIAAPPMNV